jgi:DNA modification methylase
MTNQIISEKYSIYNGDCVEVMKQLPDNAIDFSIYSPPFASMYTYSSDERDLGNCKNYEEFLEHYKFVVSEIFRILKPGRLVAVHCMDIPGNGDNGLVDFPGDIIRLHQNLGFRFWDRKNIWKEPLRVAIRTRQRALMHCQLVSDTTKCRGALADYLLIFKKRGENQVPVEKPVGLTNYAGDIELMNELEKLEFQGLQSKYKNWKDDKTNRLSQFIWRRYASSAWEDIRANVSLSYDKARDKDDDRHVCPLQLDIITRAVELYTNKDEVVFTPFMGIGSEVYASVMAGRKGLGAELKPSYFRQAVKNLETTKNPEQASLDFNFGLDDIIKNIEGENDEY